MSDTELTDQIGVEEPSEEDYEPIEYDQDDYSGDESRTWSGDEVIQLNDGSQCTIDQVTEWKKAYDNDVRWKTSNQKRSEGIKKERAELDERVKKEDQRLKDRETKQRQREIEFQRNFQRQRELTINEKLARHADFKLAATDLKEKYPDLNHQELNEWVKQYNFTITDDNNPHDMLEFAYLAWKGSQLDDLLREARADVVREAKNKKGCAPVAGVVGEIEEPPIRNKEDLKNRLRKGIKGIWKP